MSAARRRRTEDFRHRLYFLTFHGIFLGLYRALLLSGLVHPRRGFDHDRPGHFVLEDAYRLDLDQLQHCEKGDHHFVAAFDLGEQRVEQDRSVRAQNVEQMRHLLAHGDLFEGDVVKGVFGQAVDHPLERAQKFEYRQLAKTARPSFFGRRRRADENVAGQHLALVKLSSGFLVALIFQQSPH